VEHHVNLALSARTTGRLVVVGHGRPLYAPAVVVPPRLAVKVPLKERSIMPVLCQPAVAVLAMAWFAIFACLGGLAPGYWSLFACRALMA
jgi:hypothetical protein